MIISSTGVEIKNMRDYLSSIENLKKYNNFMIDLETTGVKPDINQIIEIAVVPFGMVGHYIEVADVDLHLKFKLNDQQLHRKPNLATLKWWGKQNEQVQSEVFKHFQNYSFDNRDVLMSLAEFIVSVTSGSTQMWAKPTAFDFMYLQSIFSDYQVPFPFKFQLAQDLKSFMSGINYAVGKSFSVDDFKPKNIAGAHNSLLDCYYQLDWLKNAINVNAPKGEKLSSEELNLDVDDKLPF